MIEGSILGGKFLCKRQIGLGGMGAVYEGEHLELGKRVAIKVIEPSHALSGELVARFRREARAASRVDSEHTVQVFDVGRDETFGLYMVMEYLTGEDLASRLSVDRPLDVFTTLTIGYQLADALEKLHAAGVVHRDLKPANVFLQHREGGMVHVKILDFGVSKLDEGGLTESGKPSSAPGLTGAGIMLGTPHYMSPEQAQGLPVDRRTDVWALGAVLYECLAGVPPFGEQSSYAGLILRIVTTTPRPLAEVAPWVPPRLAAMIHEALTADLDRRIPDCATFSRKLLEAAPAGPTKMTVPGTSFPAPATGSRPKAVVSVESRPDHRVDAERPDARDGFKEAPPARPKALAKGISFLHDEQYVVQTYGREVWARVLGGHAGGRRRGARKRGRRRLVRQ